MKRLAIPRELTIRGRRWRVRFCKDIAKREGIKGCRGLTVPDDRTIWIWSGQSKRDQSLTLVHEVLHACAGERAIPLELEERLVSEMESSLHSLLLSGALVVEEDRA